MMDTSNVGSMEPNAENNTRAGNGLSNITNKLHSMNAPVKKPTVTFAPTLSNYHDGEENTSSTMKNEALPSSAPTPQSARRLGLPAPQREMMEEEIGHLQSKLQSIARNSRRTSLSGVTYNCAGNATVATRRAVGSEAPSLYLLREEEDKETSTGGEEGCRIATKPVQASTRMRSKTHAADQEIGGLAAKLQSLKRSDAVRMLPGRSQQQSHSQSTTESTNDFDACLLSRYAQYLFGDQEYVDLCGRGMNAQLTRSKDGGTDATKIKELAEIVKLLRRGMKETQQRTHNFVEQVKRFEREVIKQIESVKLSGDSTAMAAQAELARARREAASAAANHKSALAQWQGELDVCRSELAALRRDIERVEAEREKAREEARRLEAAKETIENELKEVRKTLSVCEREAQADRNSVAQALFKAREAAEKRQKELESALAETRTHLESKEADVNWLKEALSDAENATARVASELKDTSEKFQKVDAERKDIQEELYRVQNDFKLKLEENQKACGDAAHAAREAVEWKEKAVELMKELEKERSSAQENRRTATEDADKAAKQLSDLRQTAEQTAAELARVSEREAKLIEEKAKLEATASASAQGQKDAEEKARTLEERLSEMEKEAGRLASERNALHEEAEKLRQEATGAEARIAAAKEEASKAVAEAEEKSSRLSQLEGELEALQECTMGLEGGDQKELLQRMVSKIASLENSVAAAEARRREAHNQLVELKGNIRVFCRLRPHVRPVATVGPDGTSVRLVAEGKEHVFVFDRAFTPEVCQEQVFDEVSDVVQSALDGYKVCLFSYGQTGAGKTFTMQGSDRFPEQEGIIPRAISKIISTVSRLEEQGWEYSLEASYIELYNEQLRDLLVESSNMPSRREAGRITEANPILHAPNGGHTTVVGANRVRIKSESDAAAIVQQAAKARAVESTAMNSVSSRSHAVFMLYITGKHEASDTLLQGSLNLVDLAGSERLARSGAEGARAKEACSINKSLSALGDVFAALSSKSTHIPYRNSKLTHLLQPCLGGSGKTLMFVNINPEPESAGESMCSLRFAAKVNACETAARGGATRHVSSIGDGMGFSIGGSVPQEASAGRMSMNGYSSRRQSLAPQAMASTSRRQSIAPAGFGSQAGRMGNGMSARRMSMIPSAGSTGTKRTAMGPPPSMPPGSSGARNVRSKYNH